MKFLSIRLTGREILPSSTPFDSPHTLAFETGCKCAIYIVSMFDVRRSGVRIQKQGTFAEFAAHLLHHIPLTGMYCHALNLPGFDHMLHLIVVYHS